MERSSGSLLAGDALPRAAPRAREDKLRGIGSLALCLFIPLSGCGAEESHVQIESDSSFTVTLTNGERVRFTDTLRAEPAGRDYSVEGVIEEIGAVLVHVQFWEGHAYLLFQRTSGDTTWIDSAPIFSPERDRFLTASMDLEAGYLPNRVRIYRASADTIELEWSLESEGMEWGPSAAEWMSDDAVRFIRNVPQWRPEFRCVRTPMTVVRSGDGWQIQAVGEASDTIASLCG